MNYGEREYIIATEKWCTISIVQYTRVKQVAKTSQKTKS